MIERPQPSGKHRLNQPLLGSKVIVHGSQVDVGVPRDGAQRRGRESVFREERLGGVEDADLGVAIGGSSCLQEA